MKHCLVMICAFAVLLLQSCASQSVKAPEIDEVGSVVDQGPVLETGSVDQVPPDANPSSAETLPPEPPKDLHCLVLGPGMAKAFAEVGVIEGLQDQLKDIQCIVGSEMGAVVGALYADKKSVNAVQWQLYKLKREIYLDVGFLSFGPKIAAGKRMHQFFAEIFGKRTAKDLGLRFIALYADPQTNTVVVRDDIPLADALSASIAVPGVFEAWKMPDGRSYTAATSLTALPTEIAQGAGATHMTVINVLEPDSRTEVPAGLDQGIEKAYGPIRKLAQMQEEGAAEVIHPNTKNIDLWDFQKQQELFERGREATKTLAPPATEAPATEAKP